MRFHELLVILLCTLTAAFIAQEQPLTVPLSLIGKREAFAAPFGVPGGGASSAGARGGRPVNSNEPDGVIPSGITDGGNVVEGPQDNGNVMAGNEDPGDNSSNGSSNRGNNNSNTNNNNNANAGQQANGQNGGSSGTGTTSADDDTPGSSRNQTNASADASSSSSASRSFSSSRVSTAPTTVTAAPATTTTPSADDCEAFASLVPGDIESCGPFTSDSNSYPYRPTSYAHWSAQPPQQPQQTQQTQPHDSGASFQSITPLMSLSVGICWSAWLLM